MLFNRQAKEARRQSLYTQLEDLRDSYWEQQSQGVLKVGQHQELFGYIDRMMLVLTLHKQRYSFDQLWLDKIVKPICKMLAAPRAPEPKERVPC